MEVGEASVVETIITELIHLMRHHNLTWISVILRAAAAVPLYLRTTIEQLFNEITCLSLMVVRLRFVKHTDYHTASLFVIHRIIKQ